MTRKIISLALACLCSLSQTAFAQITREPYSSDLAAKYGHDYWMLERLTTRMRRASTITLYLVSPGYFPIRALDEGRAKQAGCEYKTEDAALIASLAEVIEGANLQSATTWLPYEPRELIYLTLGGGSEIRLLFDRDYLNQPELPGRVDGLPVTVSNRFVETLYRWTAKLSPVDKCEYFVGKYRQAQSHSSPDGLARLTPK